jgi:hypothetical protein
MQAHFLQGVFECVAHNYHVCNIVKKIKRKKSAKVNVREKFSNYMCQASPKNC